jgi:hypothetical protein
MNKSDMIRDVCSDKYIQTNKEIQNLVNDKFNVIVGQNEIINTIGSFSDRLRNGLIDPAVKRKAKDLLLAAGDSRHAVRLIHIAAKEMNQ